MGVGVELRHKPPMEGGRMGPREEEREAQNLVAMIPTALFAARAAPA